MVHVELYEIVDQPAGPDAFVMQEGESIATAVFIPVYGEGPG